MKMLKLLSLNKTSCRYDFVNNIPHYGLAAVSELLESRLNCHTEAT